MQTCKNDSALSTGLDVLIEQRKCAPISQNMTDSGTVFINIYYFYCLNLTYLTYFILGEISEIFSLPNSQNCPNDRYCKFY